MVGEGGGGFGPQVNKCGVPISSILFTSLMKYPGLRKKNAKNDTMVYY